MVLQHGQAQSPAAGVPGQRPTPQLHVRAFGVIDTGMLIAVSFWGPRPGQVPARCWNGLIKKACNRPGVEPGGADRRQCNVVLDPLSFAILVGIFAF